METIYIILAVLIIGIVLTSQYMSLQAKAELKKAMRSINDDITFANVCSLARRNKTFIEKTLKIHRASKFMEDERFSNKVEELAQIYHRKFKA